MTTLADLATPPHVLHMRRSRVMIPAEFTPSTRARTVTWSCYGTFDRLLVTEANSLAPLDWGAEPPSCSVGQVDEVLFPLGHCCPADLIDEAARRALVGVHHIKFERTSGPARPNRFDTDRLSPLLRALGDGRTRRLFLCAGLHWHEWVMFTLTDDVEHIFETGLDLRRRVPEQLGAGFDLLHSHTTVASLFFDDARQSVRGRCRASIRVAGITDQPAAMLTDIETLTREYLTQERVSGDWDVVPLMGNLDFAVRLKDATPFATVVGLIERLRGDRAVGLTDVVRLTETTLLPDTKLLRRASTGRPTPTSPRNRASIDRRLCDREFTAALERIDKAPPGSDAARDLKSIMEFAEAVLQDRLLAPAALDLINALLFLRCETLRLAAWDTADRRQRHVAALTLQRMAQRLEYALRSRTSAVSLLLPSSVHPAVLHGSHALHYRIVEALSGIPLYLLDKTWPGCVLVGWGNAIQLFEGATFGTPAAWFSDTHRWWALVHEVGHQVAVNLCLVNDEKLRDWFRSDWERSFDQIREFTAQQLDQIERKMFNLALEVFADLYEFHFFFNRSWDDYVHSFWKEFRWHPRLDDRRVEHLLRACCVERYACGTEDRLLTAAVERVLHDCSGDNPALRENPIPDSVRTAAERFQLAYEALVARLQAYIDGGRASGPTPASTAAEDPLTLLKQATRAGQARGRDTGSAEQAHIILRMAEWYRDNRRELTEDEIARLPSTIRR